MSADTSSLQPHDDALATLPHSEWRFVDREEFCELLTGFRPLVRCDDARRGIRGLRDPQSGEGYAIHAEQLFARN